MPTREYSLGIVPDELEVNVYPDADFVSSLFKDRERRGAWPTGTVFEIRFRRDSAVWATTLTSDRTEAVWNVDKALVNARTQGERAELFYLNGTSEQCWAVGRLIRHGR